MRAAIEVADVFRRHGDAYRKINGAHMGRGERRVMGAITACRTAALGGHVEQCADCGVIRIAYNSCLMGTSSNGELARPAAAFSCASPCLRSPLHEPLRPGSARPLSADHKRGRSCWRLTSQHRRC
jgi:transposase-like zinc-binding protein